MGGFLDGIPPELVTGGGFASLVFLFFYFVFTGRLVPRSTHEETRADRDAWRKAYETEVEIRRVQSGQLDQLLSAEKATERLITAMHEQLVRNASPPQGGR